MRLEKSPTERRVLSMELQLGDRLADETAEWEIIGRPYTTNMGKLAHVRVRRVDQPGSRRSGRGAHMERISVRRTNVKENER